ncbi:MAG: 6-phosphofructokinase [Lachnospiraceae bacterium]|nr:6-phosphofructokinase [Lachnospiraceae bacterium]
MGKKNCVVAQSGGPTVAINASLAGVVNGVKNSNVFDTIYGSVHGILGILNDDLLNLSEQIPDEATLKRLKHTPSMYLGSCRYKLPTVEESPETYTQIFKLFEEKEIDTFFYIGGNDSMDTTNKLSQYAASIGSKVKVLGIPKTIDNDLCLTDHTPGFGSAAKYIATAMLEIIHDTYSYPVPSVTVIEIMGRDAGWLTSAAALARNEYNIAPHLIYLPEVAFDTAQFVADVRKQLEKHTAVIVAVSEGIRDKDGNYISATSQTVDGFGHSHLSGAGKCLENLLNAQLDIKVRSVEMSVLQRSAAHYSSATDLTEAFQLGNNAVKLAEEGATGRMVTLNRVSSDPYKVEYSSEDVSKIANEIRNVPREWINEEGNDVLGPVYEYLRPLIVGEPDIVFKNGMPTYMSIPHLKGSK